MQSQSTSGINQGVFNPFSRRVDTAPVRRRATHLTFIFNQKRKQISIEDRGAATTLRTTICSSIWQFQRTVWRDSETQIRKKKIVGSASGSISIRMKEMGGAIIDHLRSKYPRQRPKTNRPTLHGKNETQFAPNCPGDGEEWVVTTRLPSLRGGRGSHRLERLRAKPVGGTWYARASGV